MNRRTFLLAAPAITGIPQSFSLREERMAMTIGNQVEAHVIVSAHSDARSSEFFRREWIGRPFEGIGEFYRDSTEVRVLPDTPSSLIGTLTFHTTTIGAAAEKRDYLVGAFRRDNVAVIVRIVGDHERIMMSMIDHIASQEVPGTFEIFWNPIHLRKFIPGGRYLGSSVEESDSYWP